MNARRRHKCEQLEQRATDEHRRAERYKKRYQRLLKKLKKSPKRSPQQDTPRSRTRRLLRYMNVTDNIRRTLVFHNVIIDNLRERYAHCKSQNAKRVIRNVVMSRTLRKCKLQMYGRELFGFSSRVKFCAKPESVCLKTDPKPISSTEAACTDNEPLPFRIRLRREVKHFFVRDDVSRITAGKKETITKNKMKMQKRFLNDTLINLHRKFLAENPFLKISYSLFCQMRPFWVLIPSVKSRDTCLCKLHENLQFMADKLLRLHLVQYADIERLADLCACDPHSKACMHGECDTCRNKGVDFAAYDSDRRVSYYQWIVSTEEKMKRDGSTKNVKITRKECTESTAKELVSKFSDLLKRFKKHIFNIRQQFQQYRLLKGSLNANECLVHIDFAENYSCKYSSEISGVHFGSSHAQTTLHNGVFYISTGNSCVSSTCFCTISDCRQHDPPAIWVYLDPVLKFIKNSHPAVDTLHFLSDGPATQYRQKLNFYYLCTKLQPYGFQNATWNFSEAGHGKGAADGVGGALKRTADKLVSLQHDINSPLSLYNALLANKTSVVLFYVSNADVISATANVPFVPIVHGTMNIHQIITTEHGRMRYRDVSCFCSANKLSCTCYKLREFSFVGKCIVSNAASEANVNEECPCDSWKPIEYLQSGMVGKYCLIKYDGKAFPGKILQVDVDDDDALIQCMAKIGDNRFFWPLSKDISWYMKPDMLSLIPEPLLFGRSGRHYQVSSEIWEKASQFLGHTK